MDKKIRILALCDSPTAATGFAQVSRNVLRGLAKTGKYDIDVLGINYYGDYYDRDKHPYNIYPAAPAGGDIYGRARFISAIAGNEEKHGLTPPWDILFTIQDPFIIEGLGVPFPFGDQIRVSQEMWKRTVPPGGWFTWIAYFPVDSAVKENWVTRAMCLPDYPVAYCKWGQDQILRWDRDRFEVNFNMQLTKENLKQRARLFIPPLKDRLRVIHHGVDTETFKPISKEERAKFRKEFFGGKIKPDTFLVINVSRNQPRKDLTRTLAAFAAFKQIVPNSHLYLHCKNEDAGGGIDEMARNFDLAYMRDYSYPTDFNAGVGYPIETVNKLYNAADLCITTTLGEGWGFITSEAMATKTPIVAPNITSILDIFNSYVPGGDSLNNWFYREGYKTTRGVPVLAGSTTSEWVCLGLEDNERVRPLTNVDDMVQKMHWVYKNQGKPELTEMVERAYKWVQELSWDNIVAEWDKIFTEAYQKLEADRELGYRIDKAGRNDPCPCGSGEKFKRCHGAEDKQAAFNDWVKAAEEGK